MVDGVIQRLPLSRLPQTTLDYDSRYLAAHWLWRKRIDYGRSTCALRGSLRCAGSGLGQWYRGLQPLVDTAHAVADCSLVYY